MVRKSVGGMIGGMLLALALIAAQSANAEGAKTVLVRKYKPGATTYKATVKTNVQGMDIVIEQSQKNTIKTVKDNGTIVILSEDLGGVMKFNGTETEQKGGAPTTETRDKLGKLIDYQHEADPMAFFTPEVQRLMASTADLILTDKEVAEGDTWESQLDNPVSRANKVKVKTTYQGIDKVDGVDLWKFKQSTEAVVNTDGSKTTTDVTVWINPKDGLLEKVDAKIKDVPTTQAGPIEFTLLVQRVKAAEAKAPK